MARTVKFSSLPYSRQVAYCAKRLADPDLHPHDRAVIEKRLEQVKYHCRVCGRLQETEESKRRWEEDYLGSECRKKLAGAA